MGVSRRIFLACGVAAVVGGAGLAVPAVRRVFHPLALAVRGRRSVEDRMREFGDALGRVEQRFRDAGRPFPPARVVLVGLKAEKRLDVYAGPAEGPLSLVAGYPVLAASGLPGPKTREGDRQVPEGVYDIESVNPNSRYHVSLRIGYPNELDRASARRAGRTNLGGDIMIHGGAASVGCLAIGDPAAEEVFVLAVTTGLPRVKVLLSPVDLRRHALPAELDTAEHRARYDALRTEFARLGE